MISLDWLLLIAFVVLFVCCFFVMDQVALYESQEPDVDITNDAAAQSDDDVGSQVYEAVKLPESVYKVVSITATTTAHVDQDDDDADAALQLSDADTVLQVSDEEPEEVGARPDALAPRGRDAPDVAVDNLPARIYAPVFRGRLIPDGPPPKSTRGWSIDELKAVIKRCDLERLGSWRQGGQQERKVFEGDDFLINIHIRGTRSASTVWVQGKRANEVNTRLLAARGA